MKSFRFVTIIREKDYAQEAVRVYSRLGPVHLWHQCSLRERRGVMRRAHILVVRLSFEVTAEVMDAMPNLRVIATSTTGLNHIDTQAAEARGIRVVSLRGRTDFLKNIPSTAEETMGLMLALLRNIPWSFDDVKRGRWRNNYWTGYELKGKTLSIIGVGRLGKLVARYARAFQMEVLGVDPYVSLREMHRLQIQKTTLTTAFRKGDIISLHVSLADATMRMITRVHFHMMKRSAVFVNTARAELIEQGALHDALKRKWIRGAAVDVLDNERSDGAHLKRDPLIRYAKAHNNLIVLPHVGGTTFEAMKTTQVFLANLVARSLRMQ